ncbi:MAG TPA: cupin domain-containing protein [Candidatus Koribacter sp.]|jgi:hypothetical protein
MRTNLESSAPHVHPAFEWEPDDDNEELVMYRNPEFRVEGGLRECLSGKRDLSFSQDEVWFIMHGHAQLRRDSGDTTDIRPQTLVHFKEGWNGKAFVDETLRMSYMRCRGGPSEVTPVLHDVHHAGPLNDWGAVSQRIVGMSHKAGILLSRSDPPCRAESGVWTCTPGTWRCEVKSDEFCHFVTGSSNYTHDNGEIIEILPDTLAFFPSGWKGICEVRETVRKAFMIR